nr:plasmid recombination protein [Alkalibacterium sp. 20]
MGVVPFDKDNKLSSKRVLTRQKLIEIQENLPKHLQEKGFDIERGERNSQAKHKSVTELKLQTAKEVQELAQERGIIQSGVSHYSQELHEISEQVEEKQALVENLENKAEKLQFEVSDWQRNIKRSLEGEKNALEVKIEPLKNLHEEIETELGILEARKNGTKREFEAVLDDIQDFKAFNDLVGRQPI